MQCSHVAAERDQIRDPQVWIFETVKTLQLSKENHQSLPQESHPSLPQESHSSLFQESHSYLPPEEPPVFTPGEPPLHTPGEPFQPLLPLTLVTFSSNLSIFEKDSQNQKIHQQKNLKNPKK